MSRAIEQRWERFRDTVIAPELCSPECKACALRERQLRVAFWVGSAEMFDLVQQAVRHGAVDVARMNDLADELRAYADDLQRRHAKER